MDTKEPHLFVSFKEVETWSLTAKKDYYENLRNICIKRKKHSTGSSKFVAFIAPLFRNFLIEIRGAENLIAFCTLWRSQMRFRAVALRSITAARF